MVDRRGEAAGKMRELLDLPSMSLDPTAAELKSNDGREKFRIGFMQILAELSGFDQFDDATARSREFFEMALDFLGPDPESINLRTADIAPAASFDELRDRLHETIVVDAAGLQEAIGSQLSDTAWVFEFESGENSGRVQFGPMKIEQLDTLLGVTDSVGGPSEMLFLTTETKTRASSGKDMIENWEAALTSHRRVAERAGTWLAARVA
jgi:hypothetical protein